MSKPLLNADTALVELVERHLKAGWPWVASHAPRANAIADDIRNQLRRDDDPMLKITSATIQWIVNGACIFILPDDALGDECGEEYRTVPLELAARNPTVVQISERLPPTHSLTVLFWDDGTGIAFARRTPPTDAWITEKHLEARLRHQERANSSRKCVARA